MYVYDNIDRSAQDTVTEHTCETDPVHLGPHQACPHAGLM